MHARNELLIFILGSCGPTQRVSRLPSINSSKTTFSASTLGLYHSRCLCTVRHYSRKIFLVVFILPCLIFIFFALNDSGPAFYSFASVSTMYHCMYGLIGMCLLGMIMITREKYILHFITYCLHRARASLTQPHSARPRS